METELSQVTNNEPTEIETLETEISSPQSEATESVEFESDTDFDYSKMAFDDNDEPLPEVTPAKETVETAEAEVEESEPETLEPEAQEATPEPEAQQPEVETKTEPEPEPAKLPSREELEGMYTEHREKTLPELEKMFQLTEEQVEALQDNPEKILPQLAAQIQYDSMMSAFNATMAALPSVVNKLIDYSGQIKSAETQFFDAWPELKNPSHVATVRQSVQAYRQANPTASVEEVIQRAGRLAMLNAGFDPTRPTALQEQSAPPTAPPKAKPTPPPGAGASAAPMPPQAASADQEDNVFAALTEAFQREFS